MDSLMIRLREQVFTPMETISGDMVQRLISTGGILTSLGLLHFLKTVQKVM